MKKIFTIFTTTLLFAALVLFSCNQKNNNKKLDEPSQHESKDNINKNIELLYKPVDKYNIEDGYDFIINKTHGVKIFKPTNWMSYTGTSQYTAIKVAHKEYGAQVSINWKEPLNRQIDDSFLDTEIQDFKKGLSAAGIELQNVIQSEITYKNHKARRIDAVWLKSIGDVSYIEKFIFISVIHEGKMVSIGCTYPEKLLHLFSKDIDRVINSVEFLD